MVYPNKDKTGVEKMIDTDYKIIGITRKVLYINLNSIICFLLGHKSVNWELPKNKMLFQCRRCGKTWEAKG